MSNSSGQEHVESIFSKLELECGLEKENKKLKEQNELLEKKLQVLEQKEIERTKINPDVQTIVLYLHSVGVYMLCEEFDGSYIDMDNSIYIILGDKYVNLDTDTDIEFYNFKFLFIFSFLILSIILSRTF